MSSQIQVIGGNRIVAEVDSGSKGVLFTDIVHSRIHKGLLFQLDKIDLTLLDSTSIDILMVTSANFNTHLQFIIKSGGDTTLEIFEGTTVSDNGTLVTPFNKNRQSSNVNASLTYDGPTVTDVGTRVGNELVLGGTGGGAGGGSVSSFGEWVLAYSTNYLLRATNISGQSRVAAIEIDWYEE